MDLMRAQTFSLVDLETIITIERGRMPAFEST